MNKPTEKDMGIVVDRIIDGYWRGISCDQGWWGLVLECDKELANIDPDYTIYQVKEKFGGLRFYFDTKDIRAKNTMNKIVRKYEELAARTCEVSGKAGVLMLKLGRYRTLGPEFADEGWSPVENILKEKG